MGKPFSHLSVICKHKDTGGGLVKPAHWEHPVGAVFHKVHYGLLCVRVAGCGYESLGLVHYHVYLLLSLEALSVELDLVLEDVDLGSKFGNHFSVHGDYARLDEGVSLTA